MERIDYFYFVVDVSGSMAGRKIGAVNDAINNIVYRLKRFVNSRNLHSKVTMLSYADFPRWSNYIPVDVNAVAFGDLQLEGEDSNLGKALVELNSKLSRQGQTDSMNGSSTTIIFLTDGLVTDEPDDALKELEKNSVFCNSNRIGVTFNDERKGNIAKDYLRLLVNKAENIIVDDFVKLNKVIFDKYRNEESGKGAEEYYNLACAQKTNRGIANTDIYVKYMDKASEMGHVKAMQCMARLYLRGKYVSPDENKAVELYKKCAGLSDGFSCYELYRYYREKGTDKESEKRYLELAAEYNVSDAQFDLAMHYYRNATEDDYIKAFSLFQKAGENGDAGAFYQMALCYRYGHGVKKDMAQAKEMLQRAARLGHNEAKCILRQGVI